MVDAAQVAAQVITVIVTSHTTKQNLLSRKCLNSSCTSYSYLPISPQTNLLMLGMEAI